MAFGMRRRNRVVQTRTTRPTLMTRLRGPNARKRTVKTTTTTTVEPAHAHAHAHTHNHHATVRRSRWGGTRRTARPAGHRRRHASFGDKISGAMIKLRGSLSNRPGLKAAGTRRMQGTSGHVY